MAITLNPHLPEFYVYGLMDPRKPGPFIYKLPNGKRINVSHQLFYVGKGKGHRINSHYLRSSSIIRNKINKIKSVGFEQHLTVKLAVDLTEDAAYELEALVIDTIGRKDLGTGPLLNLVDGGRGKTGAVISAKSLQRRSESLTENWASLTQEEYEQRTANMGASYSFTARKAKSKEKIAHYNSKAGEITKEKLRVARAKQEARETPEQKAAKYAKQAETRNLNKLLRKLGFGYTWKEWITFHFSV